MPNHGLSEDVTRPDVAPLVSPVSDILHTPVLVRDLRLVRYAEAWEEQRRVHESVVAGGQMQLLYCSHPPVYTLGRQTKDAHLPLDRARLEALGAEVFEIDRGGSVTFHGPDQVIGYPIVALERLRCGRDLHRFLRGIEEALITMLADFDIASWREDGKTGVWTAQGKVAAIGLKCSRWVSMHGFALNLSGDLGWFQHVVPCGLTEPVTSMHAILGSAPERALVQARFTQAFTRVFGVETTADASVD